MGERDDLFRGVGVEIALREPGDFLKIKETLTRIGVPSRRENKLFQSCHILHKRGRYAIVHFKELFELDGRDTDFSDEDRGRRNTIVGLLEEWGLVTLSVSGSADKPRLPVSQVKVISHRDKSNWRLESKYSIGKKKTA